MNNKNLVKLRCGHAEKVFYDVNFVIWQDEKLVKSLIGHAEPFAVHMLPAKFFLYVGIRKGKQTTNFFSAKQY